MANFFYAILAALAVFLSDFIGEDMANWLMSLAEVFKA